MKLENFKLALEKRTDATWEQFYENSKSEYFNDDFIYKKIESNIIAQDIVGAAFTWTDAKEGFAFWNKVWADLMRITDIEVESWRKE